MTDHTIKAAKAAGGTTYTNRHYPGETACAFGPEALERFYALAFAQGMERAAEICEAKHDVRARDGFPREASTARALAKAIRAHAQNQPKNLHDGSGCKENARN